MKKILIIDANIEQAQFLAKQLKKNSNLYISGSIKNKSIFKPKYIDNLFVSQYDNLNLEEYDYVMPTGATSTYWLANKIKEFKYENNITFNEKNLIVFNKIKMLEICNNLEIPIPKTYYKKKDINSYPVFYKEDFEQGGGTKGIAHKENDLPKREKLIFQEVINSPFVFGVGFLAKNGEIINHFMHKEIISRPIQGGSAVVIEIFFDNALLNYTKKIVSFLGYNGWGLAEFKYCERRKDFVFMEINGKLWASIELALRNNPDFLKLLFNVNYKKQECKRIIFINRLLEYKFMDFLKNIKYLFTSKVITERNIILSLLLRIIPNFIKRGLKNVIKNKNTK